jgi:hypothetical protein
MDLKMSLKAFFVSEFIKLFLSGVRANNTRKINLLNCFNVSKSKIFANPRLLRFSQTSVILLVLRYIIKDRITFQQHITQSPQSYWQQEPTLTLLYPHIFHRIYIPTTLNQPQGSNELACVERHCPAAVQV